MGPFCVTCSNPTQPTTSEKIWTQLDTANNGVESLVVRSAVKSNFNAWCNQILSYRALNALT